VTLLEYSSTDHYQEMYKKLIIEPDSVVCEICGREHWKHVTRGPNKGKKKVAVRFTLHHKTYESIWSEKREDMMVICYFCHQTFHAFERIVAMDREKLGMIYQDLKRSTGWDHRKMDKTAQEELFAIPLEEKKQPKRRKKNHVCKQKGQQKVRH